MSRLLPQRSNNPEPEAAIATEGFKDLLKFDELVALRFLWDVYLDYSSMERLELILELFTYLSFISRVGKAVFDVSEATYIYGRCFLPLTVGIPTIRKLHEQIETLLSLQKPIPFQSSLIDQVLKLTDIFINFEQRVIDSDVFASRILALNLHERQVLIYLYEYLQSKAIWQESGVSLLVDHIVEIYSTDEDLMPGEEKMIEFLKVIYR